MGNGGMGMGGTLGSLPMGASLGMGSSLGMGTSLGMGAAGGSQGGVVVRMQGLPFSATESEIAEWFSAVADPVKVEINYSPEGRPSGDALALFANLQDAKKAM